jgi:hypothetical protein
VTRARAAAGADEDLVALRCFNDFFDDRKDCAAAAIMIDWPPILMTFTSGSTRNGAG